MTSVTFLCEFQSTVLPTEIKQKATLYSEAPITCKAYGNM